MTKRAKKPSAGARIIASLKDAIAANLGAVTIDGQRWVRTDFAGHDFWMCGSDGEWKSIPPGLSSTKPPAGWGAAACCPMVCR